MYVRSARLRRDYTNKDKVTFEYSYNGFNWYPVDTEKGMDAKYIRFINKGKQM